MEDCSKILTIIVPSYNTQAYIDQCIPTMLAHSCIGQLELLLVNDGSMDHTLEKLKWYERHYPGTVTVIDQANGGHGSVINKGIQCAKGKFIKVIDGDDWVIPENLEKMIRQLQDCRADMVVHPYVTYHVCTKRKKVIRCAARQGQGLPFGQAAGWLHNVAIQAVTYRTGLLRENGIRVREHCFYEDTQYNIYPVPYVDVVSIFDDPVVVYRIGTGSQSIHPREAFKNRKMHRKVVEDCMRFYEKRCKELPEEKKTYIKKAIHTRIRSQYMIYLKNYMTAGQRKEIKAWDLRLKEMSAGFYRESNRFPVSLLRMDIQHTYPFLKLLYRIYDGLRKIRDCM